MKQECKALDLHVPSPRDVVLCLLDKVEQSLGATITRLVVNIQASRLQLYSSPYVGNTNFEALLAPSHLQAFEVNLQVSAFRRKEEEDWGVGVDSTSLRIRQSNNTRNYRKFKLN
jgi:hypothetical protein